MNRFALIIIILFTGSTVFAQQNVQDTSHSRDVRALVIVSDISYPKKKPFMKSITFNKSIIIIHGAKVLSTIYSDYVGNSVSLSNDGNETNYVLFPNQKVMMKSPSYRKEIETSKIGVCQLETKRSISATNSIKQIMNINCNEYKVTIISTDRVPLSAPTTNVFNMFFYTYEKLKGYNKKYSNYNVDGLVLGSDYSMGLGCDVQERAVSISEQMVDSSIFDTPKDYLVLTYEELYDGKKYREIRKAINKEIGFGAGSVFKVIFSSALNIQSKASKTSSNASYVASNGIEFSGIDSLNYLLKDTIADSYYYQQKYEKVQAKAIKSINKLKTTEASINQGNENSTNSDAETLKYIQYLQYLMKSIREQAESKGFLIPLSVEEAWSN